ncbi:hypothetical protein K491DRAFT_743597 [Lophiostoma macrostomum CBS 122681]|uniref:Zn(2)-C6 fungal-type domain-containing protein n=1 Tax=Lophiostoma macrostomum CBS 122681 TaxID=1314788 RepID=A0A6A6TAK9_9PLEO|nr:hypothetical protein K491DRAFT_743597 [Lophiostoma macrostomum CBS 122681]
MSESAAVSNRPTTANSFSENVHGLEQMSAIGEGGRRRQSGQQQRQLLSCTKCRERKVKCDRTKPCSACCARGQPKECQFVAEGGDYAPIQQSYELRKLRTENLRLKERLRASKIPIEDNETEHATSPGPLYGDPPGSRSHKRRTGRPRRFQGSEWSDSIYFGSPGLANLVNEFASLNVTHYTSQCFSHLTHAMPRASDMYAPRDLPLYPFATLFSWNFSECIPQLIHCLPPKTEIYEYLDAFDKRVQVCFFPHTPTELTRIEVDRFLSDATKNTEKCPNMLAVLFAALALGSQHCVWDKCGGKWVEGEVQKESEKGNLYITASMHALRMASFMNRPTLLGIQALIMMEPYLTNSGRFLDAWTLFGTTIRLAHSIGLHRNPKYLDPAPPSLSECSIRQSLWWWMLHMDQQYSMTLGRPLGISGTGDCPPPDELTTNQTVLRYGEFVHKFTVTARQILSSDKLSTQKIDDFTDQLRRLLDTMPEMLQFNESWLSEEQDIPEWPLNAMAAVFYCKAHTYLILLNRQRHEKPSPRSHSHHTPTSVARPSPPSFHPVNPSNSSTASPATPAKETLRGRALVLSSSEDLLTAFLFFYYRLPAALICWTVGQQAFNSCMILILDAMERGDLSRMWKVEKVYALFDELRKKGVHKLASLAVERISWGLVELQKMQDDVKMRDAEPLLSGGEGLQRLGINLLGARKSEAGMCPDAVQDTVMGNAGMLLLEDPGLQSFVDEGFSPFTWEMAGTQLECSSKSPVRLDMQEEDQRSWDSQLTPREKHDADTLDQEFCGATAQTSRSSEKLQGDAGRLGSAPGSAPVRFATFPTAPPSREQLQPQGLPTPTSPPASTTFVHSTQHFYEHGQGHGHEHFQGWPQLHPPHLRHHSYPSPQDLSTLHPSEHALISDRVYAHGPMATLEDHPISADYITAPNTLAPCHRAFHPLSVPEFAPALHETDHSSVHSMWTARPVAPMSSLSEPALGAAPVSAPGHAIPLLDSSNEYQGYHPPNFPLHLSVADGRHEEQAGMETWRQWAGNSGAR